MLGRIAARLLARVIYRIQLEIFFDGRQTNQGKEEKRANKKIDQDRNDTFLLLE